MKKTKTNKREPNWFSKALHYNGNKHDFSLALVCINQYLRKNPECSSGKIVKVMVLSSVCQFEEAHKILKSINLRKNKSETFKQIYFTEKGNLYKQQRKYKMAIKCYDKVIALAPEKTEGYIYKGTVLALTGKYEEAKKTYSKAIRLKGYPDEALYNIALIQRARLKLKEAKQTLVKALSINPHYKEAKAELKGIEAALVLQSRLGNNTH